VYTADHRVDITVTARATTTGSDAKWTQIEISTVGPTLVSPSQAPAIDFVGLGQRSAAVTFASSREVTIANGDVVDLGALEVSAIDLKSPAVKPEGALCMVNGFLGGSSRLASGQYVAGNMPSRAP